MRGIVYTYFLGVLRTNTIIARNLKELNTLVLNRSSSREIGWLHGLMPHCKNLLSIEIRHNQYINPHVTLLQFYSPNLQSLCLIGCLSNPLNCHFPENKALDALITTHQCASSGKVLIYIAPCAAYSKATCGEKMDREQSVQSARALLQLQRQRSGSLAAQVPVRCRHASSKYRCLHQCDPVLHKFTSLF